MRERHGFQGQAFSDNDHSANDENDLAYDPSCERTEHRS